MAFDNPLAKDIWTSKYRFAPSDIEVGGAAVNPETSVEDTWTRVAQALADCEAPKRRAALARPLRSGADGLPVPARRPDPRRRRDEAQRDPIQLLRHGRHSRRPAEHLRPPARGGRDHAAGRRRGNGLFHHPPHRRAGRGASGRRRPGPSASWRCGTRCARPSCRPDRGAAR